MPVRVSGRLNFSDDYLEQFQDLLSCRQRTSVKLYDLEKVVSEAVLESEHSYKEKWGKIKKLQLDILALLREKNTNLRHRDGIYSVGEVAESSRQQAFKKYLDTAIGFLPIESAIDLENLHSEMNQNLQDIYGTFEFLKRMGL
jgi:hypothetical protein